MRPKKGHHKQRTAKGQPSCVLCRERGAEQTIVYATTSSSCPSGPERSPRGPPMIENPLQLNLNHNCEAAQDCFCDTPSAGCASTWPSCASTIQENLAPPNTWLADAPPPPSIAIWVEHGGKFRFCVRFLRSAQRE
ncbi:unnamed protein product [Trichogramma brassicae]|uniref:Uncharacterized protein n=1 Tax=Trichogramma brassicae TaxID=86971 RepID=A0A6H5I1Z1_9HYME|nr:unnamed protein product [Trichogramma brassicae]